MSRDQHTLPQKEYMLNLMQEPRPFITNHLHLGGTNPLGETLAFTNYYLTRNGHAHIPVMGEFHFSRFPRQYWEQELRKIQAGGVTIVATYVFWIHVEEEEGIFDWSGDRDVRAFVEACQRIGLPIMLRIGPFAHGECRNGGLPDWLYSKAISVRSNDERYLSYVQRFYAEVAEQVQGLLFKDGGPIIGIQIENEYMHCGAPWELTFKPGTEWVPAGEDGVEHMLTLKQLAIEEGLQVPIYSCTAWVGSPVPEGEFLPMHGGYAFTPWNPDPSFQQGPTHEFLFRNRHQQPLADATVPYDATQYPYAGCELGGGIQITYHHRPLVPAQCPQAMAVVALGSGSNWLGYYMYHGGSQPVGKHSYFNENTVPRISYDFQAPVREYGQLNESYHRLRTLHLFLHDFDELLAPMTVALPQESEHITPDTTDTLRYAARHRDGSGFLFINNYQDHATLEDHDGVHIHLELPGESVSLPRQPEGMLIRKGVSTIFPFNLRFTGNILLKYATAQLLTKLQEREQTTYVFFAPDGVRSEFALDSTTYKSIRVTGGLLHEEDGRCYITTEPGLSCSAQVGALDGTAIQLLILTEEQALSAWKLQLWGEERLVLSNALVFSQQDELHCYWQGQASTTLAAYPPLPEGILPSTGTFFEADSSIFTVYSLTVPAEQLELPIEHIDAQTIRIGLPAQALKRCSDLLLSIDYLGDVGQAYLDGRLVSDHFANGLPWEIGLKRFLQPDEDREIILRLSPLRRETNAIRYFPTGMAFRPGTDGIVSIELRSISCSPEYHVSLRQRR